MIQFRANQFPVSGIVGFGIWAFLSPQYIFGKNAFHSKTQQAFLYASIVFEFPWNGIQILRNSVVAERDSDLQRMVHTHSVLAVQKGLHEPAVVQIDHFLHLPLCIAGSG